MTQQQIEAYIKRELLRMRNVLWLEHWTIRFGFSGEPEGDFMRARVLSRDWEYKQAVIEFYSGNMRSDTKEEITNHVTHELLHVVAGEMKEKGEKHEERVIVHLTDIITGLDEAARKKAPSKARKTAKTS
jgi:hypothetical protein